MHRDMVRNLTATRMAIGVGAWAIPRVAGKVFGLDPDGNPQLPYMGRLFGIRDVALAVGVLSSSGSERSKWLGIGVACDLADAAAGVLAGREGELPRPATVLVTGTALSAAAMGIVALATQGEAGAEQPA